MCRPPRSADCASIAGDVAAAADLMAYKPADDTADHGAGYIVGVLLPTPYLCANSRRAASPALTGRFQATRMTGMAYMFGNVQTPLRSKQTV